MNELWAGSKHLAVLRKFCDLKEEAGRAYSHDRGYPRYAAYERALTTFERHQADVVKLFAQERGWRRAKSGFPLSRLAGQRGHDYTDYSPHAWDHPYYFREKAPPYAPVAVVVHVYADDLSAAQALATRYGLPFEPLPWSWYLPTSDTCFAGVYQRARR